MFQFDTTIHLSDVIVMGGGIVAFITTFLSIRDAIRDLKNAVGTKDPPVGLLGDVEDLKEESRQHRDWLIGMRGRRVYDNLHHDHGEQ